MTANSGGGGVQVSIAHSVASGLVQAGGALDRILTEAEGFFLVSPPRSSVEAFDLLDRAAKTVDPSFSAGIPADLQPVVAGQDKVLLNNNGITTLLKATGEIVVTNHAGQILLHLVPRRGFSEGATDAHQLDCGIRDLRHATP